MPTMPPTHRVAAQGKQSTRYKDEYQRRGTRQAQGYTNAWLRAAELFKKAHPLCAMCMKKGKYTPVFCVDHIVPHRGDSTLFWDESNWQSLCNPCHQGPKRQLERTQWRAQMRKLRAGRALSTA